MTQEKLDKTGLDIAGEWSDHYDLSIKKESARAKVILSACYLDELLQELLKVVLKPDLSKDDPLLDGPQAPLGTYSAKIEMVARLGLISDDVKKSLHLIRKIRNEFAHKLSECSFKDRKILDLNTELNKLNDVATEKRRQYFSEGPMGDFEKSVSWLIYWLKHTIQKIPTDCPSCGSQMEHRSKLKAKTPKDY